MSDSNFDAAWRAFTEEDARVETPPQVRRDVMAAWDATRQVPVSPHAARRYTGPILATLAAAAVIIIGIGIGVTLREHDATAGRSELLTDTTPVGIVRLAADTPFEAESLRVVRLRVSRTSLEAFGVALIEPDTSGLVDLDVLVGDDGLAREILRAQPVVDVVMQ